MQLVLLITDESCLFINDNRVEKQVISLIQINCIFLKVKVQPLGKYFGVFSLILIGLPQSL